MSDEDSITPAKIADPGAHPDILLYDFSKYLLTSSLLMLGGVLSLGNLMADRFPSALLIVVIVAVAIGGFLSLTCLTQIVRAVQGGTAVPRAAVVTNQLSMGFLGAGVGAFLTVWILALV